MFWDVKAEEGHYNHVTRLQRNNLKIFYDRYSLIENISQFQFFAENRSWTRFFK